MKLTVEKAFAPGEGISGISFMSWNLDASEHFHVPLECQRNGL